ncbi:MAG: hypothetical protein ABI921_08505, partial [Panacibacter sp.]
MLEKTQDDLLKTLIEKIFEESKNIPNFSGIEEFQKKIHLDSFVFYQKVINAIQCHPLSKSIEHSTHKTKAVALKHCWDKMMYIKIAEFLNDKMEATLFTLRENNQHYEKLINLYNKKIEVATAFLSKKEFIVQEIERIKAIFLKPFVVSIGGDFKVAREFSFSKFKEYSFDLLSSGNNYQLDKI